jgi:hypothetical protein
MASVYLHTTGTYYAKYFNSLGKRVSKNTGVSSKREALRIANGFESDERDLKRKDAHLPRMYSAIVETAAREAASGELTLARAEDLILRLHRLANPSFKLVSFVDHLKNWVEEQKAHVGLSTFSCYMDMRRRFTTALGKKASDAAVGDLTTAQVKSALQQMKDSGLKSSTVNQDLRAVRRALHKAVNAGLAKINVADRESVRVLSEKDSTVRAPFTAQEVRTMTDHPLTSDEWKGCILIAAHTGLRLSDVVSLGRQHVSGDRLVVVTKKTGKPVSIPLTPTVREWIGEKQGAFSPIFRSLRAPPCRQHFRES